MRLILLLIPVCAACVTATVNDKDEWEEIFLYGMANRDFYVTSVLGQEGEHLDIDGQYGPSNLFDTSLETAWVEGSGGDGTGEAMYISFPANCRTISVFGGYGKSQPLFESNNRVAEFTVTALAGINPEGYVSEIAALYRYKVYPEKAAVELEDVFDFQTFDFPFSHDHLEEFLRSVRQQFIADFPDLPVDHGSLILRFEISDVYKGSKYDDTCISEILFDDEFMVNIHKLKYPVVENVYIGGDSESVVYVDIPGREAIQVYEDPGYVLQILELSDDRQWMTLARMPGDPGDGRVETEYLVFHNGLARVMNGDIERFTGRQLIPPFFLDRSYEATLLEDGTGIVRLY